MLKSRKSLSKACREIGISRSTYLRYEGIGILPNAPRDGRGWRYFSSQQIRRLKQILRKRGL